MISVTEQDYWLFAGVGIFTIMAISCLWMIGDRIITALKHRCPPPPVKNIMLGNSPIREIVYYRGRRKLLIKGKKTKVCIWQYAVDCTASGCGGYNEYIKGNTTCIRCKDGLIVRPDKPEKADDLWKE
jgi:hypothetical protein